MLQKLNQCLKSGIPQFYDFGLIEDREYMSCELLGPSLKDLYQFCGNNFTLNTIVYIGL